MVSKCSVSPSDIMSTFNAAQFLFRYCNICLPALISTDISIGLRSLIGS